MPSIINATTTNGLVTSADNSGSLQLQTNSGTTAVTVDTSQNVGIGVTNPSSYVGTNGGLVVAQDISLVNNSTYPSNNFPRFTQISGIGPVIGGYQFAIRTGGSGSIAPTERARFTETGLALFGSTSATFSMPTTNGASFKSSNTGGGSPIVEIGNTDTTSGSDGSPALLCFKGSSTTSSSARFIQFSASGATQPMGAIVGNGATNAQFASVSDAREKTNINPIAGSLEKINALKPVSFDMIVDGSHVNAGFVAQDVLDVFPEFVVDNMSSDGQEQRYGLTGGMTGGIVAHLVKAIQELKAELDATKAEVQALKGVA